MNPRPGGPKVALALLALMMSPFVGCSSTAKDPKDSGPESPARAKELPPDTVTTVREKIRGQIIQMDPATVTVRKEDGGIRELPRGVITDIEYGSQESYDRWHSLPMRGAASSPSSPSTASTWVPSANANQAGRQELIDWFAGHEPLQCAGPMAKALKEHEDFDLFVPPGGKVVFYDRRNLGYHVHVLPSGYQKPVDKPELVVSIPEKEGDLPEGLLFASAAVETKVPDGTKEHKGYTMSDLIYARLRALSTLEAMLTGQSWAGGRPMKGTNGPLWCLGLPCNQTSWYLFVAETPERPHAKLLKNSWVQYQDYVLDATNIIDTQAPDGTVIGRVFVLPYPDPVNPNSDAPVTLYGGSPNEPSPIATVTVPPRYTVVLPPKAPQTRADVWLHFQDVSSDISERALVAYGTGLPTAKDVTLVDDPLGPATADKKVTISLDSRDDSEFPAVAWLLAKRLRVWKATGGRLTRGAPIAEIKSPPPVKPSKVIAAPPVAHALPILFVGRNVQMTARGADPAANLGTGMTDALARQMAAGTPNMVSSLTAPPLGGGGGGYSNTTNVQIVMPSPSPGVGGGAPAFVAPSSGLYAPSSMMGPPGAVNPYAGSNAPLPISGFADPNGNFYNAQGQNVWNPNDPSHSYYTSSANSGSQGAGVGVDQFGNAVISPSPRRNRP
jgi:hypothetical protein